MSTTTKPTAAELWPLKAGRPTRFDQLMRQIAEYVASSENPSNTVSEVWDAVDDILERAS